MTSKKLGALLRSVPPATAAAVEEAPPPEQPVPIAKVPPSPSVPARREITARRAIEGSSSAVEPEVPLQVLIPANVRRELAIKAAERGESLRALVLRAIRGLDVKVTDADIKGKRGRGNS